MIATCTDCQKLFDTTEEIANEKERFCLECRHERGIPHPPKDCLTCQSYAILLALGIDLGIDYGIDW